jgi:hypothetical protein
LRGAIGGRGVDVTLATELTAEMLAAATSIEGVTGVEVDGRRLLVSGASPTAMTPALIRAIVAAGADVLEVRERASTLEEAYFEVMGVRPDRGEAA